MRLPPRPPRHPRPHRPPRTLRGLTPLDHDDHVALLRGAIPAREGPSEEPRVWADFGAGWGAFTLALADLLGPGAEIHAIDRDAGALRRNAEAMRTRFPEVHATHHLADFTSPRDLERIALPPLDGLLMANSLHFQPDPLAVVRLLRGHLKPGGRILLVEYNIHRGNPAVPHPIPYARWQQLAAEAGLDHTELLATRPSRFLREIYSAVSW
ncbi:MAG: trans-aconitate 2-methyltransferase [Dehalococcoidia bacterium]